MRFYSIYGFAMLKTNPSAQAVPVFQSILAGVPSDEVAVFNAEEGIRQCQERLEGGSAAPEPTPEPTPEG